MSLLRKYASRLCELAPSGFYVGLRNGFSYPADELNRLPETWIEHYTTRGLVVHDPVLRWVYANSGITTWDRLGIPDREGVLKEAARHGLRHGAVASVCDPGARGRRSYGTFTRSDRRFTETELAELFALLRRLHQATGTDCPLTMAETEALRLQAGGLRLKQISAELHISMSAVKARLANAKRKLGAQTPSHAAAIARGRGVL